MKLPRPSALLLKNIAFTILLLLAAIALYQLSARFPLHWDTTQSKLNSLEPGSINALKLLHGEVKITVYATEQDAKKGDLRRLIREFIAIYQRYKTDITLTFVDPLKEPDAMRKASIQSNGEMVVEYGGRSAHLVSLNEQTQIGRAH